MRRPVRTRLSQIERHKHLLTIAHHQQRNRVPGAAYSLAELGWIRHRHMVDLQNDVTGQDASQSGRARTLFHADPAGYFGTVFFVGCQAAHHQAQFARRPRTVS
ncbi:hypothetical protein B0G83_12617 [Paraburkholderia sp. BL21I4N1]|nr:hypothetical protein B0G83_12617 [Paraburkholderia sp. BL21I4N1]